MIVRTGEEVVQEEEEEEATVTDNETEEYKAKRRSAIKRLSEIQDDEAL